MLGNQIIGCAHYSDVTHILYNEQMMGRTSSTPISACRLNVDKDQGLRSGLLSYTSHVLYPVNLTLSFDATYRRSSSVEPFH